MFVYLLRDPEAERFDTSSVRLWGSGAAPLALEIVEPFERRFGGVLLEGYGLTEAAPVVAAHRLSGVRKLGSVGPPVPGVEVRMADEADRPLPAGEVGEICVRGPNVMLGYYRSPGPSATAGSVPGTWAGGTPTGTSTWWTGKKDLILRGGFNIYPREVEEVLAAHPAVAEAAVVGAPDALMGEEVSAFVVLREGARVTAAELTAFCERHLARFKCPQQVRFVDRLPRTPIGKVLRKELRTLAT